MECAAQRRRRPHFRFARNPTSSPPPTGRLLCGQGGRPGRAPAGRPLRVESGRRGWSRERG